MSSASAAHRRHVRNRPVAIAQEPGEHVPLVRGAVNELLQPLTASGIAWSLLRSSTGEPEEWSDVDLLIDSVARSQSESIFRQFGLLACPSPSGEAKTAFVRYSGGHVICLDVHWQVVQAGVRYMNASDALARRRPVAAGAFVLAPEDELIHVIMHNLLRRGPLREGPVSRIRELCQGPLDETYLRRQLRSFRLTGVVDAVRRSVLAGSFDESNRRRLRRIAYFRVFAARPANLIGFLRFACRKLGRRRRGGLIAVVGPDGSGKSTVIRAIQQRAPHVGGLRVCTTYLGPWGQLRLPLVKRLRKAGITPEHEPVGGWLLNRIARTEMVRGLPASPNISLMSLGCRWLSAELKGVVFYSGLYFELLYRYVREVVPVTWKGRWVVADRYITDMRYLYKSTPSVAHPWLRRLMCRWYPRPDLYVLLDNEPRVVHARKPQLTIAELEEGRRLYRKAMAPYRHIVVSTTLSPEEIADQILVRIMELAWTR